MKHQGLGNLNTVRFCI